MDKKIKLLNAKAEIVALIKEDKTSLTDKEWKDKTPEERLLIALNGALALIEHAMSIVETGDTQDKTVVPSEKQHIPVCKREVIQCACSSERRPYDPDEFACCLCKYSRMLINAAREQGKPCRISDGKWGALINWLNKVLGGDDKRHVFMWKIFGKAHSAELHECEKAALLKASGIAKDDEYGWIASSEFTNEMQRIIDAAWLDAID